VRWPRRRRCPAGHIVTEINRDNSRSIRVSVANVQRTLLEGAALTVLHRVPVPQLLAQHGDHRADAADRADRHLPVHVRSFGFTINTMTLMALSLCVGLLIDDAIVVRENIVRHVQMGKSAHDAALEGTDEIGLAVLATTLSIVAVFLPIGFMGGIVGKFFHEFGITIVAAVLISMFVSFTLDPMLSSVWHDPQAHGAPRAAGHAVRPHHRPRDRRLRPPHRAGCRTVYQAAPGLVAGAPAQDRADRHRHLRARQLACHPAARRRVRAQGRLLGDGGQLLHAGGLVAGSHRERAQAGRRRAARDARGAHTVATINSGFAPGQDLRLRLRAPGRPQGPPAQRRPAVMPMRERLARIPGITVTNIGVTDLGGGKTLQFSLQGSDLASWSACGRQIGPQLQHDSRPGRPGQHAQARQAHGARGQIGATPPPTWA
jgi:HAE1 family hydrophobic/amphiphilic exporter-1